MNDLHYSVDGYKILGKRFAEKSIELIHNNAQQIGAVEKNGCSLMHTILCID